MACGPRTPAGTTAPSPQCPTDVHALEPLPRLLERPRSGNPIRAFGPFHVVASLGLHRMYPSPSSTSGQAGPTDLVTQSREPDAAPGPPYPPVSAASISTAGICPYPSLPHQVTGA